MNFDRVAAWYRWLEWVSFGPMLQRCRLALLDGVRDARRILILGEGDGRFLERLRQVNPAAEIVVIDASRRMIELAKRRCPPGANVQFIHADARQVLEGLGRFDAIVTLFFLDCFSAAESERLICELAHHMSPGGRWLWADFTIPGRGAGRWFGRAVVAGLLWFFRRTADLEADTLVDCRPVFAALGFELVSERSRLGGLLASRLWRLPTSTGSAVRPFTRT